MKCHYCGQEFEYNEAFSEHANHRPPSMELYSLKEILDKLPINWAYDGASWDDDLLVTYSPERHGLLIYHNDPKAQKHCGGDFGFIDFDKEAFIKGSGFSKKKE